MRVITLQEPWASLIAENIKVIETRSWPCYQYGELYIHAGKSVIPKSDSRKNTLAGLLQWPLHYGTIFAKCILSDCIKITEEYAKKVQEENPNCYLCGDFTPGRYAWILENIEPIEPIEKSGKLGIWYYNESS
ncbi:MAG: hypothetical protein ACLUZ0_04630 [Coprococcus sp.]